MSHCTCGMIPMHVTPWHGTYRLMSHYMSWYQWSHYGMVAIIVTVPMYVILWHETNVYQHYKIRHTYTNCNICQYYTYGMASMHVTCTICIMSLLMPWHNTTSVNTKTICVPLLRLISWYGSYHY